MNKDIYVYITYPEIDEAFPKQSFIVLFREIMTQKCSSL